MQSAIETRVRSSTATSIRRVVSPLHHDGKVQRFLFFVPLLDRLKTHFSCGILRHQHGEQRASTPSAHDALAVLKCRL
jgi:hypothetical protein